MAYSNWISESLLGELLLSRSPNLLPIIKRRQTPAQAGSSASISLHPNQTNNSMVVAGNHKQSNHRSSQITPTNTSQQRQ
jgi:hypothetical protein